jgi:hypothetical protein
VQFDTSAVFNAVRHLKPCLQALNTTLIWTVNRISPALARWFTPPLTAVNRVARFSVKQGMQSSTPETPVAAYADLSAVEWLLTSMTYCK